MIGKVSQFSDISIDESMMKIIFSCSPTLKPLCVGFKKYGDFQWYVE